jgi:hypothetical protein
VDDIPALDAAGVTLVAVGIGSVDAAREFAARTNFPLDRLYADETAATYSALVGSPLPPLCTPDRYFPNPGTPPLSLTPDLILTIHDTRPMT